MRLFTRFRKHKDGAAGASSECSALSPSESPQVGLKSPLSWKSNRSSTMPTSPWLKTHENPDRLSQCEGCSNVEILIRRNLEQSRRNRPERVQTGMLHTSFSELDECAQTCQICRVFRQALVLQQVTFDGIKQLEETSGEVVVRWGEKPSEQGAPRIFLNVELKDSPELTGVVNCNNGNNISHLALLPNGLNPTVTDQAKAWLNKCLQSHVGSCENLKWSNENPRLLVEILSEHSVQLRENQKGDYVALSYCWGNMQLLSPAQQAEIQRGKTMTHNLNRRFQPFDINELPTTVQDALRIIYAMGIRYAWVDTMCIVQDKPDGVAAMHIVYSNALFTLCSCATTQATAKMFDRREAWTQATEPCRLGGQWLTTPDMSLTELRLRSPLAERAWTLQEERLSPRMLYVSSNRLYWSCAKGHEMEMQPIYGNRKLSVQRPLYATLDRDTEMPMAQEFLWASFDGSTELHTFWADIVKSYALRSMSNLSDRLTALSGLAARYLDASRGDEYLAGLWANNLAEGLAWRVSRAAEIEPNDNPSTQNLPAWPSWSWAVLPLESNIDTDVRSVKSSTFQRIVDSNGGKKKLDRGAAGATINEGQLVKEICVTGRKRKLWESSSQKVEWSQVSRQVEGSEKFSFAANREQDVHAVQSDSGRILVYEDRKREIMGQLDFQHDVRRIKTGQVQLWALELGLSTMLLLESCGDGYWRRIGVAWNVREDYFTDASTEILILR